MTQSSNPWGLSLGDERQDDWLGLRLTDQTPSLSEQYGIDLIDERTRHWFDDHGAARDDDVTRFETGDSKAEPAHEPQPTLLSCSAGSAFGAGPSVSVSRGPTEYGFTVPLGAASAVLSHKSGMLGIGMEVGLTDRLRVGGVELAALSAGFELIPSAPERSSIAVNARVLGVGCKLSIEAQAVARQLEDANREAAEAMAPAAQRFIEQLGLPLPPTW